MVREGGILGSRGLLSIMCYTGHAEGVRETAAVYSFLQKLDQKEYRVFNHEAINRPGTPSLITAVRLK